MSKWTDIRDNIVKALAVQEVTEEVKEKVTAQIVAEILPAVENVVHDFVGKIKEQAPKEQGWNKIRDSIILPLVLEGAVWAVKTTLNKTLQKA